MALTKTTAVDVVDPWQVVTTETMVIGNAEDISGSFESILYIEAAIISPAEQNGMDIIVEVSYGTENWIEFISIKSSVGIPDTTTLAATEPATETTILLTDNSNFSVKGTKFFIEHATIGSSETVRMIEETGPNSFIIASGLLTQQESGSDIWNIVDEWIIGLPLSASQVRVLYNNPDADTNMAVTSRISKVTDLG